MSIFNLMKLEMTYDPNKENYEINGQLFNIRNKKRLYSIFGRNNIDNIFTVLATNNVKFNRVFVFEVVEILKYIVYNNISFMNIRGCKQLLDFIKETEYEHEYPEVRLDWNALKRMEYEPFDYAKEFYNHYEEYKKKTGYRGILLDACVGAGKAQNVRSKVRIPDGWKAIGSLKVGDKVMAIDGTYTTVTGVFPQGMRPIYEIKFKDGRSIKVDENHLWEISTRHIYNNCKLFEKEYEAIYSTKGKLIRRNGVIRTKRLYETFNHPVYKDRLKKNQSTIYIPLCQPEKNKDKEFFIHPYILGCILGDGNISKTTINLYISDLGVVERLCSFLDKDYTISKLRYERGCYRFKIVNKDSKSRVNKYKEELTRLKLMGRRAWDKFIPREYLNSSEEQRWELLRGLMDTDGWVDKTKGRNGLAHNPKTKKKYNGNIMFGTTSELLAYTVSQLVYSMGDICRQSTKIPHYTYKNQKLTGRTFYKLSIRSKTPRKYFTRQSKRLERLGEESQYSGNLMLAIESVTKLNKYEKTVCIMIDHPRHLYITEDYIVTHNTNMSLTLGEMLNVDKFIIVCPLPTLDRVWIKSITSELYKKKDQPVWHSKSNSKYNNEKFIIVHYEAMEKVLPIIQSVSKNKVSVIVDESHNFADKNSKRTLQLLDLVNVSNTKNLILQSGTPIKAYSTEIINVYRFLDARVKGRIYDKLYSIYSNPKGFFRNILPDRYQDISYRIEKKESNLKPLIKTYVSVTLKNGNDYTLDTIRKEMGIFIERRIKEVEEHKEEYRKSYELCLKTAIDNGCTKTVNMRKYKSTVETIIRVGKNRQYMLIPNEMKLANDMEKEIEKYLPNEMVKVFRDVKTLVKYPILRIQGECLGQIVMGARIKCHRDIANELDYETYLNNTLKDTIIFSNYVEVCEVANKRVKSLGYNPINIYGESTKQLASLVKDFTSNKKYNPLITTYKALSTGVPLTNANIIITLDLPFRMYLFEQAVGRAWRVGQDSQVTVYIPSLDTGEVPNINARNFDIISFFNEEVERLTGVSATLDISETKVSKNSLAIKSLHNELFNNGILNFNLEDMEYRDLKIVENDNTNIKNPILNW